jgi:ankyrin repeat protein
VKAALLLLAGLFLVSLCSAKNEPAISEAMRLLSAGDQKQAEATVLVALKREAGDPDLLFLAAVLERSRFDVAGAAPIFARTMQLSPSSPEGLASACILGVDLSRDQRSALYYFNALLIVSRQNPDSVPIHWMAAVMTRQLTKNDRFHLSSDIHKRILECGIREYEKVLALMAPQPGPVLIHQTMANLLDDVQGYDAAQVHREAALKMERRPWSLQAAADTLTRLDRPAEAVALMNECIAMRPNDANDFYTLGIAFSNLGRAREAAGAWDNAANIDPKNQAYLKKCAMSFRDLGDYAAARKYTLRALANNPGDKPFQVYDARLAALLGEPDAAELLSKAGSFDFERFVVPWEKPSEPWSLALESGNLAAFRQMRGSHDINAPVSKTSQTPLMIAACHGWEHIAADLIQAGVKLDLVDANGDTALHYSAQFTQPRVMKLLLDAGAKTDLQDKWGQTPLIMAASDEYDRADFRMLMEKNAGMNLATPHGGAPLHYAAGHGDLAMVKALVARGANVNQTIKNSGATPLITACRDWAHSYIVSPLLSAGADVNARDKNGRTALHFAVDPLLNIPLVELLMEKGANPAQTDNFGVTPIAQARLLGFEDIAVAMEKKAGQREPFRFPHFESTDPSLSAEERNASLFVLPILLAQGHPLGKISAVPAGEKAAARKELSWMFGIGTAADLEDEIHALEEFEPRYREDAGQIFSGMPFARLNDPLMAAAKQIHASCAEGAADETAWVKAHILYLADLGMSAGFLERQEGETLIRNASGAVKAGFSSWQEFARSFVLGAEFHNGWEAERYKNICDRIAEAGISWP